MWQSIGNFLLTKDWQYSNPVQGEIFRVRSSYIDNSNNQYLKAVVASIFVDGGSTINLVESRRLSYRLEPDIFTFYFPFGLGKQRIGVKKLDTTNLDWSVEVEVFQPLNQKDEFVNYIISRFGELMPSFNKITSERKHLKALTNTYNVDVSAYVKIADSNEERYGLTIYNNSDYQVVIGTGNDSDDTPGRIDAILEKINPNSMYELPVSGDGSIYTGSVYAAGVVEDSSSLDVTEFVPSNSGNNITNNTENDAS